MKLSSVQWVRRIGTALVNVGLGWQKGLTLLGADTSSDPLPGTPDPQFNKATLTLSYLQPFSVAGQNLSFSSLAHGQWNDDALYSPQRLSLGGQSSVRGSLARHIATLLVHAMFWHPVVVLANESGERYRRSHRQSIEQVGATLSGEGVALTAGQDVRVVASRIEAVDDLSIDAGRDITLLSAADSNHYERRTSRRHIIDRQVRQQGSELVAGDDVALAADNTLALSASSVDAGDDVYLYGGNAVALLTANDQDYRLRESKSSGALFRKKSRRDEVNQLTAIGSEVNSGGDLTVVGGNHQTYAGARLTSGEDIRLISGGGITFAAASDIRTESHEKGKSNALWQSAGGKGQTTETLRQSQITAQGELLIGRKGHRYPDRGSQPADRLATLNAGVDTAIHGGRFEDNLQTELEGALLNIASGKVYDAIGDLGYDAGSLENIALHALAGGAISELSGGDFKTGAVAAGAGEALVVKLDALVNENPTLLVAAVEATGATAAAIANDDPEDGAYIAGQGVRYNYLTHTEEARRRALLSQLEECRSAGGNCTSLQQEYRELVQLDRARDERLDQACSDSQYSAACRIEVQNLKAAFDSYHNMGRQGNLVPKEGIAASGEFLETATQYGEHRSTAMSEAASAALAEMPMDAVTDVAGAVKGVVDLGVVAYGAVNGDPEARLQLRQLADDVLGFLSDPIGSVEEGIKSELARADQLESAGQFFEADVVRSKVFLGLELSVAHVAGGGFVLQSVRKLNSVDTGGGHTPEGQAYGSVDEIPSGAGQAPNRTLTPIDNPVDLTNGRSGHILANHRAGAGKPGKTEFPSDWSDDRIIHQVSDIATDPNLPRHVDNRGTPYVSGTRDGLDITVTFFPDNHARAGQIASAYPTNVTVNLRP